MNRYDINSHYGVFDYCICSSSINVPESERDNRMSLLYVIAHCIYRVPHPTFPGGSTGSFCCKANPQNCPHTAMFFSSSASE